MELLLRGVTNVRPSNPEYISKFDQFQIFNWWVNYYKVSQKKCELLLVIEAVIHPFFWDTL